MLHATVSPVGSLWLETLVLPQDTNTYFVSATKHQCNQKPQNNQNNMYLLFLNLLSIICTISFLIYVYVYIYISFWLFLIQSLFFVDVSGQWLSETHGAGCCQVTQSPGFLSEGGPVG